MQKWFVLLVLAALFVLVGGCAQETPSERPSTPVPTPTVQHTTVPHSPPTTAITLTVTTLLVSETTITITDNAFNPANLTVMVGSQVRWVNGDDHPHNIEFSKKMFSTSHYLLGPSQSFSQQFDQPGTYDYDCLIHPYMHGTITVVE